MARVQEPIKKIGSARSTRHDVEVDGEIERAQPRTMKSTGPARQSLEPAVIEPVDAYVDPEKLKNLAFMEEEVTVLVHASDEPTAPRFVEVWNDGRKEVFQRGEAKTVKRKFVEVLRHMVVTKYRQEKVKDAQGIEGYRYVPYSAPAYPFVVENDTPEGQAWLKRMTRQG